MYLGLLLVGVLMMAATVAIHTTGSVLWLHYIKFRHSRRKHKVGSIQLFYGITQTAVVLLLLHFFEVFLWALLYMALPGRAGLKNLPESIYFSITTFTTLGFGDITLGTPWNHLAGMEAMVGITVFGLTTAFLFAVIQQLWSAGHKG